MSAQPACAHCGALLSPGEAYCSGCGQPVASARPNAGLLVFGVLAAVGALGLMVVIAIGFWFYLGRAKPSVSATTQTAAPASAPETAKPQPVAGDEFLGAWFAPESYDAASPSAQADITRVGDHLQFMDRGTKGRGETTPRMELKPAGKGKLTGTYFVDANDSQPVELELTAGGDKMVMTLSPPASEIVTETWLRARPEAAAEPTSSSASAPVSAEQALRLVSREPAVQAYAKRLKAAGKKVRIELDQAEDQGYVVHVYELVEAEGDTPGHTATFGWYGVDRKTGRVRETTP